MEQLSDPLKRIVVEMVGGSDRPTGPPGLQGLLAHRAFGPAGPPGLQSLRARRASRPKSLQASQNLSKTLQAVLACVFPYSSRFAVLARVSLEKWLSILS